LLVLGGKRKREHEKKEEEIARGGGERETKRKGELKLVVGGGGGEEEEGRKKGVVMSGMGDGYVGTAQDAARIRRLEKQRELERKRIQDLKKKSAEGQSGLLQFGSGTSEVSICFLHSLIYLLATKKATTKVL
jgi:hypothetical protein